MQHSHMHVSNVNTWYMLWCHVRDDMQVLHVAILVKNEAAVQALLDFGISSDCRNARRWTALDEAIATRHRSITKLLYAHAHASKKARMKEKKMQLMATCNELPNYSVKVPTALMLLAVVHCASGSRQCHVVQQPKRLCTCRFAYVQMHAGLCDCLL